MELTCKQCNDKFYHSREVGSRGRNPVRCPECLTLPISKRYPRKKAEESTLRI